MSKYLFQDAEIGDEVNFCGHRLEVKPQKGHCPDCFFHGRTCSGIACTGYEREDGNSVYYKEIKKKTTIKHHLTPNNYGTTER